MSTRGDLPIERKKRKIRVVELIGERSLAA